MRLGTGRRRAPAGALAAVAAGVCLAGCGASEPGLTRVERAAKTQAATSWKSLERQVVRGPVPTVFVTSGIFDAERRHGRFVTLMRPAPRAGGRPAPPRFAGEEIRIGDVTYFRNGEPGGDAGRPWTKRDPTTHPEAAPNDDLTPAGDPAAELDTLRAVSDDFEALGEELVRGVATTRYRATLAVGGVSGRWDVWIGDGLIRRVRFTDASGDFATTTEYFDFGVDVRVNPPPAHLVGDE